MMILLFSPRGRAMIKNIHVYNKTKHMKINNQLVQEQ